MMGQGVGLVVFLLDGVVAVAMLLRVVVDDDDAVGRPSNLYLRKEKLSLCRDGS
jgi:hypothetical protein